MAWNFLAGEEGIPSFSAEEAREQDVFQKASSPRGGGAPCVAAAATVPCCQRSEHATARGSTCLAGMPYGSVGLCARRRSGVCPSVSRSIVSPSCAVSCCVMLCHSVHGATAAMQALMAVSPDYRPVNL